MSASHNLSALGLTLPALAAAAGAYIPAKRCGNLIFTAGQIPRTSDGHIITGKVGADLDIAQAVEAARLCTLNALAAIASLIDIDKISDIVKVVGFVASASGFTQQPAVVDGASSLLKDIFGERGQHARSAVGVAELPLNAAVEIEFIVSI